MSGFAVLRILSGQPLEGTGEEINSLVLDVMDDEARAKMTTRKQLQGDSNLMQIVGREDSANSQIARVFAGMYEFNKQIEVGASEIRRAFPINSVLDIIIVRGAAAFKKAWEGGGGPGLLTRTAKKFGEYLGSGDVEIRGAR